jgi:hypothetical protein
MIGSALELRDRWRRFHEQAGSLTPEQFRSEYFQFLTEMQGSL